MPFFKKKTVASPQLEWRDKTLKYVAQINAFVDRGIKNGWDSAGKEPKSSDLKAHTTNALKALRQNQTKKDPDFRDKWPPAHLPFAEADILKDKAQGIPKIALLSDGSILARIGATYAEGRVVHIKDGDARTIEGIALFGACPNRRYFANINTNGEAYITNDWQGPVTTTLTWPTGKEGVPEKFKIDSNERITCEQITAFPCGTKALLVGSEGIFVLTQDKAHRLYPDTEYISDHFEWILKDYPDDPLTLSSDMAHGTISRDGKRIAIGAQDSSHLVFNEKFELISDIGHHSEYPHYALFTHDDSMVVFNSCHFYNGCTIGVAVDKLQGLKTEPYEEDERVKMLEDNARVYAGVSRCDEIIIGDAGGYIRAVDESGQAKWQLFLGSSIGDIDISEDGRFLIVSTYAGFLATYDLEAQKKAPHQIATNDVYEVFRWIFWKNEKPLVW